MNKKPIEIKVNAKQLKQLKKIEHEKNRSKKLIKSDFEIIYTIQKRQRLTIYLQCFNFFILFHLFGISTHQASSQSSFNNFIGIAIYPAFIISVIILIIDYNKMEAFRAHLEKALIQGVESGEKLIYLTDKPSANSSSKRNSIPQMHEL